MNQTLQNIIKITLTFLFGLSVCLFFGISYAAHLHYHEQFQLFLLDSHYLLERIAVPGGLAEYIAEFLTQFYYHSWTGAVIIALLLMLLQQMVWVVSRDFKKAWQFYPLTFIPSFAMWMFLCDENSMLAFTISVIIALALVPLFKKISNSSLRIAFGFILFPALYWCIGGAFFITVILAAVLEFFIAQKFKDTWTGLLVALGWMVESIFCPLLVLNIIHYPMINLYCGIGYYRFPAVLPYITILTAALSILVPLLFIVLPSGKKKSYLWINLFLLAVIICGGTAGIRKSADMDKELAMTYDHLTRMQQWNKIIAKAEAKRPTSPFAVACLNLALAKTDNLGERMFEFYQRGTEGLFPSFQRDFTSPLPASEVYYHLGMINTAQRYTFEAMEAIPNNRKSVRSYKRLAETNLINGEYEVAKKYLYALTKTAYYKRWAEYVMNFTDNEEAINQHPEWGEMRRLRYEEDFLFSPSEKDIMLGLLVKHNNTNRMAFEYMLAHTLLSRNIESFMRYYPLGHTMGYKRIPRSYQESLVFVWTQNNNSFEGMPWTISPQIKQSVLAFATIYMKQKQDAEAILKEQYGDTYWSYLLFKN